MNSSVEACITALVTLQAAKQNVAEVIQRVDDRRKTLVTWESSQISGFTRWPSEQDISQSLAAYRSALDEANAMWDRISHAPERAVLKAPTEITFENPQQDALIV
jgi:hypothetical protein